MSTIDEVGIPVHVEELAERLVRRDAGLVDTDEYEHQLEQTRIHLHHNHLPKLADVGLVEYDRETNVVTSDDTEPTAVGWFEMADFDELVTLVDEGDGGDSSELQVIEGRESAIELGRQLADEAEEELFCMFVSTDLLEPECIRRAEEAIERDVTMYMGSQNPEVRELTRNRLPEAIIWEPLLDWMNTPSYPRVGRLVLIDRRKVMLSVLNEPALDEVHPDEVTLLGAGEDNPLVVLVRELLGARLDHLDYQSEHFRGEFVA